jgi:hypothetical protein
MDKLRVTAPNTYSITDIADHDKETRAAKYDIEGKGYLTFDQLVAWYQAENDGRFPNLNELSEFIGKPQHEVKEKYLFSWQMLSASGIAGRWKGDFHIDGFGDAQSYRPAGNVRTGRFIGPTWNAAGMQRDVDQMVFLVDFNLIKKGDVDNAIKGATLVVGPKGFPKEYEGAPDGEKVELPMELYTQDGYMSYNRFGPSGWVPEKKVIAAQVDTSDLRNLGPEGVSFYIRLELDDGRKVFINKDGVARRDFDISKDELKPQGPR